MNKSATILPGVQENKWTKIELVSMGLVAFEYILNQMGWVRGSMRGETCLRPVLVKAFGCGA